MITPVDREQVNAAILRLWRDAVLRYFRREAR